MYDGGRERGEPNIKPKTETGRQTKKGKIERIERD